MAGMSESSAAPAPRIVVTAGDPALAHDPDLARRKTALYADAVRRHGAEPVVVNGLMSPADREAALAGMAGLLLTGGADLDPGLYGEALAGSVDVDRDRDALELAAWQAAESRGLPVLGICRGFQAINVFAGGSLIQDVPDHAGTSYGEGPAATHNLEIDPDSRFGRALAAGAAEGLAATDEDDTSIELTVNTFHHQAVSHDRLSPVLRAVGWAASSAGRIVEAAESRDSRWVVGVQCHPERTDSTPDEFEGLFDAFVRACRDFAATAVETRAETVG